MKKLMIAAAIICAAAMSYGAAANWSFNASNIYDGAGDKAEKVAVGTLAYLFDASKIQQSALFDVFAANTSVDLSKTTGYVATSAAFAAAGTLPVSQFSYGEQGGGTYNYFFAIVDGKSIYLSNTRTAQANSGSQTKAVAFGTQAPTEGPSSKTLPTQGFVAAGQWAATVPEPTTGLLMLLGMAGLALRRRRA